MWVDIPVNHQPVLYIAENSSATATLMKQDDMNSVHKVAVCESHINNGHSVVGVMPTSIIGTYYSRYITSPIDKTAKVLITSQPKHGNLEKTKWGAYAYSPSEEFTGIDIFTMEVTTGYEKFILVYSVHVIEDDPNVAPNQLTYGLCKSFIKKISDSSPSSNYQITISFGSFLGNFNDLLASYTNA